MTQAAHAHSLIDQQLLGIQEGLMQLQAQLDELPFEQTFNRLGLEFRVRQLTSIAHWLDECCVAWGLPQ